MFLKKIYSHYYNQLQIFFATEPICFISLIYLVIFCHGSIKHVSFHDTNFIWLDPDF